MGQNAQEEAGKEWGRELTRRIGQNVRRYRQNLGWSAQDLSNETKLRGYPIPRSTIANIEGRPKNTIALQEAIVLADSLGVPLSTLLWSPYEPADNVRALPNWETPTYWAWRIPGHGVSEDGQKTADEQEANQVRQAVSRLHGARMNLRSARAELEKERAATLQAQITQDPQNTEPTDTGRQEWLVDHVARVEEAERVAQANLRALGVEPWPISEHVYGKPPASLADFWETADG